MTRCSDCGVNPCFCGQCPAEVEEVKPEFCIDSDSAADWLLQKYAALDAEIVLITAQAQEAVKRLQADRQSLEHLYQGQLEAFVRERIADERRGRKSLILPHGTVGFRTVPASVRIVDEQVARVYAERTKMPNAILVTELLRTGVYGALAKKALEETGELLPGIEYVPERESFHIKQGKKEEQN